MPGIDDFKDLSNAVVDGGNKMKASLTATVEAAKGMDKILDAVTKQQIKSLRVANSYRNAMKGTAERLGMVRDSASGVKKSVHDISASLESATKAARGFVSSISDASGELVKLARYDVEMSGIALAQRDMEKLTKASTLQLKAQRETWKLGKRQLVQTVRFNKEYKKFRDYSRIVTKDVKQYNAQLKIGKNLGGFFSDMKGDADIQGQVSIDVDQTKLDAVRDAIAKLRTEIEGAAPVRIDMDLSKLEEAAIRLDELKRALALPINMPIVPAPVSAPAPTPATPAPAPMPPPAPATPPPAPATPPPAPATPPPAPKPVAPPKPPALPPVNKKGFVSEIAKAMQSARRAVSTGSRTIADDMGKVKKKIADVVELRELEEMRSIFDGLSSGIKQTIDASVVAGLNFGQAFNNATAGMKEVRDQLQEVHDETERMATADITFKFPKQWDKELLKVESDLASLRGSLRNTDLTFFDKKKIVEQTVALSVLRQKFNTFKEILPILTLDQKVMLEAAGAAGKLDEATLKVIGSEAKLTDILEGQADAARTAAESDDSLTKAMNRQWSMAGQVNKSMKSGAEEAKSFAGGVESTGGGMLGAGLAAFFLFKKLGELASQYKDAAVNLKRFNVELAAQSKRMFGAGASDESFKRIRNELSLTREQSGEFFDVLNQGVNSAAGPLDRLVDAASRLRETFGGDQTKRLKEYVDLLNEIPTIDTDLSFTATADDRAAALFDLAKKGKIGTVMELQAAGLAGGVRKPLASNEDVKLLNNAQRTDKTVQDIKDGLLNKFFPTWGPQFSAIADNTFKLLSVVSAGFAVMGAMKFLAAAKAAGGAAPLAKGLPGMLKTALFGAGGGKAASSLAKLGTVAKGITGTLAIAGIAFSLAGMGADKLAERFDVSGDKTEASMSRLSAGMMKTTGAIVSGAAIGAALGTALLPVPGFGTAIGAVAGAMIGVVMNFENMGKEAQALGKTFQNTNKYTGLVAFFGKVLEIRGKQWEIEGKLVSGAFRGIWSGTKKAAIGIANLAVATKDLLLYNDEELTKRGEAAGAATAVAASMERLSAADDDLLKAMLRREGGQQVAALEMGRIFGRLNSEVNNAKKALFDFRNELAGVQIANLAKLGGTTEQFNSSLSIMTGAIRDRFGMQMKAYDKSRKDILSNAKLDANTRRDSLSLLAKAEADAAKEFIDGMSAAIEALYQSPALIESGLRQNLAKAKFDIRMETKSLGLEKAGELFQKHVDAAFKTAEETLKAGAAAQDLATRNTLIYNQLSANRKLAAEKELAGAGAITKKRVVEFDPSALKGIPSKYGEELAKSLVGGASEGKVAIDMGTFNKLPDEVKKSLGKIEAITVDSVDVDVAMFNKLLEGRKKKEAELTASTEKLKEGLAGTSLGTLAAEMSNLNKRDAEFTDSIRKGEEKLKGMSAGTSEYKKQEDEIKSNVEGQKGINKKREELTGQLEIYKKGQSEETKAAFDALVNSKGKSKKEIEAAGAQLQGLVVGEKKLKDVFVNMAAEVNKLNDEEQQLDEAVKQRLTMETALAESSKGTNQILKAELEAVKANNEATLAIISSLKRLNELDFVALDDRKRELDIIGIRAGIDAIAGKGLENHVAAISKQLDVYKEQASLYRLQTQIAEDNTAMIDRQISENEKVIAKFGKDSVVGKGKIEDNANLIAARKAIQDGRKEAEKQFHSMFDDIMGTATNFQDTMDSLAKRPEFKAVTAELDFSGARMEAAAFSDDWANMTRKSVELTAKASKERLALEKESVNKEYKIKKEKMESAIDATVGTEGGLTKEEAIRAKAEQNRTLEANKQLELTKRETEQKKSALEAVKQAAALATEMVDMQQQVTDAESQFLTEVGGNWQSILDLQQQSVQFEKQKADIAAKMAADVYASGNRGKEFAQAQTAAKLAELKYQQKALGAQKSAYEGILGMAFGAIRDSVGARKGMNSAVMILGREASRLKTRSGMFRGAGGKIMTIDERSALSQLGAVGGGPGGGPGGPASDLPPAVQDILKKSPRKLETDAIIEAQLAEAEKTRKLDEKMSGDISVFTKKATTDKSLYTADTVTQDWLSKICDYAGQTVQAIAGLGEAGGIGAKPVADSKGSDVLTDLYDYFAGSAAGRGIRKIVKNLFVNQKDASETANKNAKDGGGTLESIDENVAKGSEAQKEAAKVAAEVAKATAKRVSEMTSPTAGNKEDLKYINKTGFQSFAGKKAPGGKGGRGGKGDVKQFPDWEEYRYEVAAEVAKGLDEAFAKEQAEAKKAKEYALKKFAPKKKTGPYATPEEVAAGKEADANRLAAGKKTAKGIADKDGEQDLRVQEDIRRFLKDAADSLERGDTPGSIYVHDVSVERALKFKQDADGKSADFNRKSLEKQSKFNKDFEAKRAKFDSSFASAAKGSDDSGRSDAQKKMFPDWEKEVISRGIGVGKDLDKQFAADKNKAENAEYKDWKSIQDKYASKGGGEAKQISDLNQGISDAIARQTEEQKQFADPVKGSAFMRQSGGLETAPGQAAPGAAGEAVAGVDSATVTGQVKVEFDNKMFRTAVAQIVGEVIRTGETRKVLTRQGFTNEVV